VTFREPPPLAGSNAGPPADSGAAECGAGAPTDPRAGPWAGPRTEPRPPLWLLDVDGVLNAVASQPRGWAQWRHGEAVADGVPWPIRYAPALMRAIRRLHEHRLVECRWLTTWGDAANDELRRLLDLPPFAVVPAPAAPAPPRGPEGAGDPAEPGELPGAREDSPADRPDSHAAFAGGVAGDGGTWWKLAAARALLAGEPRRPLVWTDDELRLHPAAAAWARSRGARSLLLSPRPERGLTPRDLREIELFCHPRTR
jgi:hypothetical protein